MANYNPGFKGTTEGLLRGAATSAAKRSAAYKMSDAEFKEFKKLAESLKERGFYITASRNATGNVTLRFSVNDALGGFRASYPPNKQSLEIIKNKINEVKKQPNYEKFAEVKRGVPEKIKRQTQLGLEKARDPSRIEAEIRRLKKGLAPNHQLHHLAGKDELTKLNNLKLLPTNLNTADDIIRAEQNIIDLNKETKLILDQAKISKNDKIRLNQLNALKKRIKNKDLKGQLKGLKSMDIISFDKDGNVIKKSVGADIKMKTIGGGTEVGEIAFSDIVSKTDPKRLDVLNMATAEIAKEIEASGDTKLIKLFHQRLKKAGLRISCKDGCIVKAADTNPQVLRSVITQVKAEQPEKFANLTDSPFEDYKNTVLNETPPIQPNTKYNPETGEFVNTKNNMPETNFNSKTYAQDNPIPVKAGTEDAFKPIKKSMLKTIGKSLAYVGAPLPTAVIDSYFVGKQIADDRPAENIAKDPLNWLGLATMSTLSDISGVSKPGKINTALRLGMSPGLIRGASRFLGLPGLAISTALTAYDQYEKYKNEEGLIYNLFNNKARPV